MLVGTIPDRIELPHESGNFIEVIGLGWKMLAECKQARLRTLTATFKGVDVSELRDTIRGMREEIATAKLDADEEDDDVYDRHTVLVAGLKAWTYEAELSPENIDILDEDTASFAFTEILNRSRRTAAERKS